MAVLGVWIQIAKIADSRHNSMGAGAPSDAVIWGGYGTSGSCEKYNGTSWSTSGSFGSQYPGAACFGGSGSDAQSGGGYNTSNGYRFNGSTWSASTAFPVTSYNISATGVVTAGLTTGGGLNSTVSYKYNGSSYSSAGNLATANGDWAAMFGTTSAATLAGGGASGVGAQKYNGSSWSTTGSLSTIVYTNNGFGVQDYGVSYGGNSGGGNDTTNIREFGENFNGTTWAVDASLCIPVWGGVSQTANASVSSGGIKAGGRIYNNTSSFAAEKYVAGALLHQYNTNTTSNTVSVRDTTNTQRVSTDFTPSISGYLYRCDINMQRASNPSGVQNVSIYSDNAGVPGSLLATSSDYQETLDRIWATGYQWLGFGFTTPVTVFSGTKYHLVWDSTTPISSSNYLYALSSNTSSNAPNGQSSRLYYNGSTWSSPNTRYINYREYQQPIPDLEVHASETVTLDEKNMVGVWDDTTQLAVGVDEYIEVDEYAEGYILPLPINISKSETITVSEAKQGTIGIDLVTSQSVTVSENPVPWVSGETLFVDVDDAITVTDEPTIGEPNVPPPQIVISEGTKYAGGFTYRRSITIPQTQALFYQTNHVFIFTGTYTYLKSTANGGKVESPEGFDIVFAANSDGSGRYPHEIRSYDATTGRVEIFVGLDWVGGSDKTFYVFYGNSLLTDISLENSAGVFVGFTAVYHLTQSATGAAGEFRDSTGNGHHGTGVAGKLPTLTTSAGSFTSGNVFNNSAIDLPALFTGTQTQFNIWYVASRSSATSSDQNLLSADESPSTTGDIKIGSLTYPSDGVANTNWGAISESSTYTYGQSSPVAIVQNTFYNCLWYQIGSGSSRSGVEIGTRGNASISSSTWDRVQNLGDADKWMIGYNNILPSQYWQGTIDEVWIKVASGASYPGNYYRYIHANLEFPSTYYTLGAEQQTGNAIGVLDLANVIYDINPAASENITVSESLTIRTVGTIALEETVTVTDTSSVYVTPPPLQVSVEENISVSEDFTLILSTPTISVSDSISITDVLAVNYPDPLNVVAQETVNHTEHFSWVEIPASLFKTYWFSDDFNRADNASLGTDWFAGGGGNIAISGNTAKGITVGSSGNSVAWNTSLGNNGQYVQLVITTFTGTGLQAGVILRGNDGTLSTRYEVRAYKSPDEIQIWRIVGATQDLIQTYSSIGGAWANGALLEARVYTVSPSYPTIDVYRDGNRIGVYQDTNPLRILNGNYIGMNVRQNVYVDDWEAGTYYGDLTVSATQNITVSERITLENIPLAVSDTVTVNESVSLALISAPIQISELVSLSEYANLLLSADLRALESVALWENVEISVSDPQVMATDTINVSEVIGSTAVLQVYASETITISEYCNLIPPIEIYTMDATAIFDYPTFTQTLTIQSSEIISVADITNVASTLDLRVTETINLSEARSFRTLIDLYLTEAIAVADINAIIVREPPDFKPQLTETVTVSENRTISVLQAGALGFAVIDNITITEPNINAVSPYPPIYASDSITVTDHPNAVTPTVLFVHASDSIVTHDTVTPYDVDIIIPPANHSVNVYEVVVVTESHLVDRDIWGARPHDTAEGWVEGGAPSSIYSEVTDPSTIWRPLDTHED
jgi:hypothetical protein